jgi:hypothetical protein
MLSSVIFCYLLLSTAIFYYLLLSTIIYCYCYCYVRLCNGIYCFRSAIYCYLLLSPAAHSYLWCAIYLLQRCALWKLFWEHSGNIQRAFSHCSGNIQSMFKEHSGRVERTPMSLHPNCKKHSKKVPRLTQNTTCKHEYLRRGLTRPNDISQE